MPHLGDAIMRSDKKVAGLSARQKQPSFNNWPFSAVMKSIRKPKVKPTDREMIFVTYLVEKEIGGHLEAKFAASTKNCK